MPLLLIVGLVLLVLVVLWIIYEYNSLVALRGMVRNQWAQVSVLLQKRADLIERLAKLAGQYLKFEKSVFENIAKLRSGIPDKAVKADQALSQFVRGFYAVMENYPQIKGNQAVVETMKALEEVEEQLKVQRMVYNDTATRYNIRIQTFPTLIFARIFGFRPFPLYSLEFFRPPESVKKAPEVDMGL